MNRWNVHQYKRECDVQIIWVQNTNEALTNFASRQNVAFKLSGAYIRQWHRSSLVQTMAFYLYGAKPSSEPMSECFQLHQGTNPTEPWNKIQHFSCVKKKLKKVLINAIIVTIFKFKLWTGILDNGLKGPVSFSTNVPQFLKVTAFF